MVKIIATSKTELASTARSAEGRSKDRSDDTANIRPAFASAAIGMSWQLALVVLLPIIGGYKLDQSHGTLPLWTLIGLVVALVSSVFVIRRALAAFGNFIVEPLANSADQIKVSQAHHVHQITDSEQSK